MKTIINPFIFIYQLCSRIFFSGLNDRSIFRFILSFIIGFSPVFIWLLIFKNAGIIPHSIRPPIHVKLAARLDEYMFTHLIGSILTIISLISSSYLIYIKFYRRKTIPSGNNGILSYIPVNKDDAIEFTEEIRSCSTSTRSVTPPLSADLEQQDNTTGLELETFTEEDDDTLDTTSPGDFQEDPHFLPLTYFTTLSPMEISQYTSETNEKIIHHIRTIGSYAPMNSWYLAPPILFCLSWIILNFDYWFKDPITPRKDILAWASYVIGHITIPIITAVWLYVFHAPGALKIYGVTLGLQNISGVLTHLLFPNAPPWFIHMYGEDKEATYDMEGYAAGLIRVDIQLGTHLHSEGFHASPIVFGAVPSLHSAMAVLTFFFVAYYARWTIIKILSLLFVILQWWATIYLDHHWRLDLIVGLGYSLFWFTLMSWMKSFGLKRVDEDFIKLRLRFDFKNGSTMGMRVFRNTKLQKFFDPLS